MKKILIVCAGLQFGGVERFSTNIVKYAPQGEFDFDYLIFDGLGDALAPEIKKENGKIISIPSPSKGYRKYIKRLGMLIDENHYDVVHSHTQFNTGINMVVARKHGVPIRIAHSHTTAHEKKVSWIRLIYENFMRILISLNATNFCACGVQAGKWMFRKHSFTVINNGVDTEAFTFSVENRIKIREQYSIESEEFVIGHSGTLSALKNQEFLIRILPNILQQKPNTKLMLMGTCPGDYKNHLIAVSEECGVLDRVIFTGAVMNVNEHLSAFDVFAFPSLREGTPIALLEAQANGLPCIISNAIPKDAQITNLCQALPISDTSAWINAICQTKREKPARYRDIIEKSGYSAKVTFEKLYDIYRGVLK